MWSAAPPDLPLPAPNDHRGLTTFLEQAKIDHVTLAQCASAAIADNHPNGILYYCRLAAPTKVGDGTCTVAGLLEDALRGAVTEARRGRIIVEKTDEWDAALDATYIGAHPAATRAERRAAAEVFYSLAESGAGADVATDRASGLPASTFGKSNPELEFVSSAGGAFTLTLSRKLASGVLAVGTGYLEGYVKFDGQPEMIARLQRIKLTTQFGA